MAKLLLVDDDPNLLQLLSAVLEDSYDLDLANTGEEALNKIKLIPYDLIVLDLLLPDMTGTEICKRVRAQNLSCPILMLTSINSNRQTEANLDAGADDYLTKPFDANVILARIRALLRRSMAGSGTQAASNKLISGDLCFDTKSRKLKKGELDVHLLPREAALLEFFLRHPDQVFSVDGLMARVWATDSEATSDTVRSHVKTLRRKIDTDGMPSRITNLRGQGYRFESEAV